MEENLQILKGLIFSKGLCNVYFVDFADSSVVSCPFLADSNESGVVCTSGKIKRIFSRSEKILELDALGPGHRELARTMQIIGL